MRIGFLIIFAVLISCKPQKSKNILDSNLTKTSYTMSDENKRQQNVVLTQILSMQKQNEFLFKMEMYRIKTNKIDSIKIYGDSLLKYIKIKDSIEKTF